jgi:hypothetical protein
LSAEFNAHYSLQSCAKNQPLNLNNDKVMMILGPAKKPRFGGIRSNVLEFDGGPPALVPPTVPLLWWPGCDMSGMRHTTKPLIMVMHRPVLAHIAHGVVLCEVPAAGSAAFCSFCPFVHSLLSRRAGASGRRSVPHIPHKVAVLYYIVHSIFALFAR